MENQENMNIVEKVETVDPAETTDVATALETSGCESTEAGTNVLGAAGAIVGGITLVGGAAIGVKKFIKNGGFHNMVITAEARAQIRRDVRDGKKEALKLKKENVEKQRKKEVAAKVKELKDSVKSKKKPENPKESSGEENTQE